MAGRWRWVADAVAVATSRRAATTSTVVLGPDGALLVDPAWDRDELAWIADDLARSGVTVGAGFATHAHHDHLLWHPGLGDAPRFASPTTADIADARHDALVSDLGPNWPLELADLVGHVHGVDGHVAPWLGRRVELLVHDGHIAGHTALWMPDADVLLAGDMLSDVELPLLETSTGEQYLAGLELLRPYVESAHVLIPGHGTVATTAAAIGRWHADDAYLRALLAGEEPKDARLGNAGMREAHRANSDAIGARP